MCRVEEREHQAFDRVRLVRPRNQVRISYEDDDLDTVVISRARSEGPQAAVIDDTVTVSYAEDLLSRRHGMEVKVFVRIGGHGQGWGPLLWQPEKETSPTELAKFVTVRYTFKKVDEKT